MISIEHRVQSTVYGFILLLFVFGCSKQSPVEAPSQEAETEPKLIKETASVEEVKKEETQSEKAVQELSELVAEKRKSESISLGFEFPEGLQRSEDLLKELKALQEAKDWENFFSKKDPYREEITGLLKVIESPRHLKLKAKYLLFEVADFLGDKNKRQVLSSFLVR